MYIKQKISNDDAHQMVSEYLSLICDIFDMKFTRYENTLEGNYTMYLPKEKVKVIRKIKQLEFNELLSLALQARGYKVEKLKYVKKPNYDGYLAICNILDYDHGKSR